ncbi:MAG: hypothetical protein ACLRSP_02185 [Flavonifractor plautii]
MVFIARWGPKGFLTSPTKIVPFNGFTTSLTLKSDSENDTSGTAPTNTRGRELRPVSFETIYLAAAGVDPRAQVEEWESLLGQSYPLYIGEKRFGPSKMKLTSVSTSEVQTTATGKWISCKVAMTLEEYSEGKTSALTSNTSGSGTSSSSGKSGSSASAPKTTASYKATLAAKKAAMNATASKADKAQKKTIKGAMPL